MTHTGLLVEALGRRLLYLSTLWGYRKNLPERRLNSVSLPFDTGCLMLMVYAMEVPDLVNDNRWIHCEWIRKKRRRAQDNERRRSCGIESESLTGLHGTPGLLWLACRGTRIVGQSRDGVLVY